MGIDCSATAAWNALQSELGKRNPISLEAFCSFELLLLVLVTQGKIYISMAFYLVKRVKEKKNPFVCRCVCKSGRNTLHPSLVRLSFCLDNHPCITLTPEGKVQPHPYVNIYTLLVRKPPRHAENMHQQQLGEKMGTWLFARHCC